jgi:hypothetical protein
MNIHELEVLAVLVGLVVEVYVVLRLYVSCYDVSTYVGIADVIA